MGSHASAGDAAAVLDGLRRIVRYLRVGARAAERRSGLSAAQLFVLERLADGPAPSISELARRTLTDPSSVSVVVARLAARGLVSRSPSAADGRRAALTITARGRALLARAPEPAQERLFSAIEQLPTPERRALAGGLAALSRSLGLERGVPPLFFEDGGPRRARKGAGRDVR